MREGRGGRGKPPAGAPLGAASTHAPHHHA